jgi:Flp pilus assembly protein TadD
MARSPNPTLETSLQRTEHTYVRLWLVGIGALCLLVALCWGGHRAYVRWQERKLMRQAHVSFDKSDLRWASMAAQRAYAIDPTSIDACRTLASIAEKQQSVEAIDWRRRAVELEPNSFGDRLALADSALRFDQPAAAAEAIAGIETAQQNDAHYQSTAAHLALTKNDLVAAEKHFLEAVRLAPNDPEKRLELAEFQLRSDDRAKREKGRVLAQALKSSPKVQLSALHVLINDAMRWRYDSSSVELAKELEALPAAPFSDRLFALDILHRLNAAAFTGALTRLESESAQSAEKAIAFINWLNGHSLALLAIDWSKRLSPEMMNTVSLRFALANSYAQVGDWPALKTMLGRGSWGSAESLRLALLAKVARETGDADSFERDWVNAVERAENDPERLNVLQKVAFQWHWPEKATAVLWMLADIPDAQREALQNLYRYYTDRRDTSGLYRTLSRLMALMPEDKGIRNNFAQISLLLHTEASRAKEIARSLHETHPREAAYASTYAFALYQAGDIKGALKVMGQLTTEQLEDPSVAAYYGVFLATAGQADEATHYLQLGDKAKLLPEEEALAARARSSLARQ